jgi:hypothetical protein
VGTAKKFFTNIYFVVTVIGIIIGLTLASAQGRFSYDKFFKRKKPRSAASSQPKKKKSLTLHDLYNVATKIEGHLRREATEDLTGEREMRQRTDEQDRIREIDRDLRELKQE